MAQDLAQEVRDVLGDRRTVVTTLLAIDVGDGLRLKWSAGTTMCDGFDSAVCKMFSAQSVSVILMPASSRTSLRPTSSVIMLFDFTAYAAPWLSKMSSTSHSASSPVGA